VLQRPILAKVSGASALFAAVHHVRDLLETLKRERRDSSR
jgi:hypothetical protein